MVRNLDTSEANQERFYYSLEALFYGLFFSIMKTGLLLGFGWFFYQVVFGGFFVSAFSFLFFSILGLIIFLVIIPEGFESLSHLVYRRPVLIVGVRGVELSTLNKKISWLEISHISLKRKIGRHFPGLLFHTKNNQKPARIELFGLWKQKAAIIKAIRTYAPAGITIDETWTPSYKNINDS